MRRLPSTTLAAALGVAALLSVSASAADDAPPLTRLTHDGHFKQRPAWSPDGTRLAFARHEGDSILLYELTVADGTERRLTERTAPEHDPAWSPDGRMLAFSQITLSGSQGDVDVALLAADGGISIVAGSEGRLSHQEWPAWSPDGARLAFASTWSENQDVYTATLDGGDRRQLTNHIGIDSHPAWTPDGRIVFASDRWGGLEIAAIAADGSDVARLTASAGLDDYPAPSPDGRQIAFVSNRDGDYEIYLMDADGGRQTNVSRSPGIDTHPAWTPDGRLTFVSQRDDEFDIYVTEEPVP